MAYLIWGAGLIGTIGALIYMAQYRRQYWWRTDDLWSVPRTLLPLYVSLCVFCVGLALNAFTAQRSISLWMAAIWASLGLLFAQQSFVTLMAGLQRGWDTSASEQEGDRRGRGWWAVVALLLVVNLALVGWWVQSELAGRDLVLDLRALLARPDGQVEEVGVQPVEGGQPLSSVDQLATRAAQSAAQATPEATATETPTVVVEATEEPLILVPTPTPVPALTIATPTASALEPAPATAPPPVAESQVVLTMNEFGANARARPELTGEVLTVLPGATTAVAVGRTADGTWFQVQLEDGRLAWVAQEVVSVAGPVETLPVVEVGN